MRRKFFIILITLGWVPAAWGALQFELTGDRKPVSAAGIASINDKGIVFRLKPGQADYTRYRWGEFSMKGLAALLVQLPAERAFIQKDARTRLLFLDFIRAEILAQSLKVAPPAQAPVAPPVLNPIQPVNPAQENLAHKPVQSHRFHPKTVTVDGNAKSASRRGANGKQKGEFNLLPGPPIPAPPVSRLSPINWMSPGGLFFLLILSGLSAYSGHEIAVFRHRPVKAICILSAFLPIIIPLIVLLLPDPAEAHAQSMAEANDRFLLGATAVVGTVADDYKMQSDETHIEGTTAVTEEAEGPVIMERYHNNETHFSDRFFSEYFSRFYQTSPTSGKSLVIQTPEVIYPVHHISRLDPESLSVVYPQGREWVEESIDYILIEEVRVEATISQ